jgi:transcriptional regulator with XRE-family HTH domain
MNAELNSLFVRDLGSQISCVRKKNGLTQAQLAELMGVEPETVSRFERGTATPSLQRIVSIADVLGVSVQHLLGKASPLKSDKIALLEHLLGQISTSDRELVMDIAIRCAKRFAEET